MELIKKELTPFEKLKEICKHNTYLSVVEKDKYYVITNKDGIVTTIFKNQVIHCGIVMFGILTKPYEVCRTKWITEKTFKYLLDKIDKEYNKINHDSK